MTPIKVKQANKHFTAPNGLDASQVLTVSAYEGTVARGNVEGAPVIVTAWLPSPGELAELNAGRPVYISFMSDGLPPHLLATRFNEAANPGAEFKEFECPHCRAKNSIVDQPSGSVRTICEDCREEIEIRFSTGLAPG